MQSRRACQAAQGRTARINTGAAERGRARSRRSAGCKPRPRPRPRPRLPKRRWRGRGWGGSSRRGWERAERRGGGGGVGVPGSGEGLFQPRLGGPVPGRDSRPRRRNPTLVTPASLLPASPLRKGPSPGFSRPGPPCRRSSRPGCLGRPAKPRALDLGCAGLPGTWGARPPAGRGRGAKGLGGSAEAAPRFVTRGGGADRCPASPPPPPPCRPDGHAGSMRGAARALARALHARAPAGASLQAPACHLAAPGARRASASLAPTTLAVVSFRAVASPPASTARWAGCRWCGQGGWRAWAQHGGVPRAEARLRHARPYMTFPPRNGCVAACSEFP